MSDGIGSTVGIVVVNYGSSSLLEHNLAPLSAADPGLIVVVVDNWTDATERQRVRALAERYGWHAELRPDNSGFGGGMNIGVARAHELGAATTVLLNPDAHIEPADVHRLAAVVRDEPLTMAAPRILRPDGSVWFNGSDLYLDDGRIRSARRRIAGADVSPWLTGACIVIGRELWDLVGGFDEEYFLYWEDVDLSWRVRAVGGRLLVCSDCTAVHDEGGTHDDRREGTKSSTYYYYNVRNRLLFASKHLSAADYLRWDRVSRAVAWEVVLQGGRKQLLRSLRSVTAVYRGVRDGRAMHADRQRAVDAPLGVAR